MLRTATVALLLVMAGCLGAAPPSAAPEAEVQAPTWPELGTPHPDPLGAGPYGWTTEDYALGSVLVGGADARHADYEYEALLRGVITVPEGTGPFPLAVFLHGQHATCSGADGREGNDCTRPYRNDKGYLYLMEHLATHGIATASILGFEVNQRNGNPDVGMWARGELVLATIEALADSDHGPRLDLDRIGLMGHSRGGEGVVTAAQINAERGHRHALLAIIALAPTDFALRHVEGVPLMTLAPYCDGDVYNLHGLRQFDQSRFVDRHAVKVQLLVMGANHNNYNTNWGRGPTGPVTSDGDDAPFGRHQNTDCDLQREHGGGRLTLDETYAQALLHMGGFLRWTLLDEAAMAPFFLGADTPPEACPDRRECPGAVHVSTRTPGVRDVFWAESSGLVGAAGVTVPTVPVCQRDGCAANVYSSAWMADLRFDPTHTLRVGFDGPQDLRQTPLLNVRVAVPTDLSVNAFGPPGMSVTFHDTAGAHRVAVDHPALFLPPGLVVDPGVGALGLAYLGGAKVSANAIAIPLPQGLDAQNVTALEIEFRAAGPAPDRILVADAWFNRATAAALAPVAAA